MINLDIDSRIANAISRQLFDHNWSPQLRHVKESNVEKIIRSIIAMENAGYNSGSRDWITAVRSERFTQGRETVARILAYPDEPGGNAEVLKFLRMLGISDEHQGQYCLNCGVYFPNIPQEDMEREIWQCSAMVVETLRSEDVI